MLRPLSLALGFVACSVAQAGWTYTILHPAGYNNSVAYGIRNGKVVGYAENNVNSYAAAWTVDTPGWTNLGTGRAYNTDGVQVVGNDIFLPWVCTMSGANWTNLTPPNNLFPNFLLGVPSAVFDGMQAGSVYSHPLFPQACYWLDSASTYVNLNPAGSTASEAVNTHVSQQVGYATFGGQAHAGVWYNSPGSFVDINPAGSDFSAAYGVYNNQQCGVYRLVGPEIYRACRWNNTAASMVELHPAGVAQHSWANATYNGRQAGRIKKNGVDHAVMWSNTSNSVNELHYISPPGTNGTNAIGIWTNNFGITYVSGVANVNGSYRAILWKGTPDQTIFFNLNLLDTVAGFAAQRNITYTVMQGVNTVASGSWNIASPTNQVPLMIPQNLTGTMTITLDGSSFLKRVFQLVFTGQNQVIGTVNMTNGDCDLSGEVDAADIDAAIADFGSLLVGPTDVDVSGEVDGADIDIVIANFGAADE
ncbi:MAG: hypothetical protein JNK63_04865 [Chthonomonas sp.]|nr:hypothetical protein [Chthonomonas sp.]